MRILITSANRGPGAALVREGRATGYGVTATTRPGQGGDVCFDVTDHEALRHLAAATGPLDVLINDAGITGPSQRSMFDMVFAGLCETFEFNAFAPLAVAHAFLPNLPAGGDAVYPSDFVADVLDGLSQVGSYRLPRVQGGAKQANVGARHGPRARTHSLGACRPGLRAH